MQQEMPENAGYSCLASYLLRWRSNFSESIIHLDSTCMAVLKLVYRIINYPDNYPDTNMASFPVK